VDDARRILGARLIRIGFYVVGRLKKGPERDMIDDYLSRAEKTGRALGIGPITITEVEDKKGGGMIAEAALLSAAIPENAVICTMDERGKIMSSPGFSNEIAKLRDQGCRDLAFVIGGADGIDPALRARANMSISFGKMVWPHMLARVMLAEQVYRATTILAGGPYHRV
jgi:23S rRNA (pseudouridine1915-N3)-methyltransferase